MNAPKPFIGLFGTCGISKWRNRFIEIYINSDIAFYNPQIEDGSWDERNAIEEAYHLAKDDIILFPVTKETYGFGSLSEVGFSIIQAINLNRDRFVIVYIEKLELGDLQDSKLLKESQKSRALVVEHLKKLDYKNVFIVSSLEEMLEISLELYDIVLKLNKIKSSL